MERSIKACLRYPAITVVMTLMIIGVGIWAALRMPRTEDPSITIRTGIVAAAYPGATSEQVEKQVTKTLEERIFKFQEVRKNKTYSTSRPGLVVINVELEKNVKNPDVFWSKLRHELMVTKAASLPPQVVGPIVDSDFGDTVAMLVAVSGDRYGYRELRDYVDQIKDTLRTVPEVGKIAVYGNQSEQIWVTSSLERMSQYFTDPTRIIGALGQRNTVQGSGAMKTDQGEIPMRTTGILNTEDEIRKLMVGMSPVGQPIYIGDFANVERRYQDPTFKVRYDGRPALMISVEMQKGHNIVEMGDKVTEALNRLKPQLPPDLRMDFIANQPHMVQERMLGMGEEVLIAIAFVILVTVLLLPMRVAVIAALAIPASMLSTLGVMNAIGLQLHQVSIGAMILVLGIVVDNAIVIADNYVELLDHKVPRVEAAWRSASEVLVPVLAATLTIIASFLPLLIISGTAGEFIMALPITVAVALAVSFLVAIYVTPLLCRTFILKGLHDHDAQPEPEGKKKFNALDRLQTGYNALITRFMAKPALAVVIGISGCVVGGLMFLMVPSVFFPKAERNQFVIDLWMPEGSRIEATDSAMKRIENCLTQDKRIKHFAGFIGQSAPRFYYNVNPQQPDSAYGQFIVNTDSVKSTTPLVTELQSSLARVVPEGMVLVQECQQGAQLEAPIEIRVSGDDLAQLKTIGDQVVGILGADPRARNVHTDFRNDSALVDVNLNPELANRLGITHAGVSHLLYGAFDGLPVSTFWEGDRAVDIVLRADPAHRATFENARNTYINSMLTDGRVPLRAIADLSPNWQISRLVRRNGVRTLTIRCHPAAGTYASDLLKDSWPKVQGLSLPPGYRLELGGEWNNEVETAPEMRIALSISLLLIYLILMVQFRSLIEPLVVMASIPLSVFGVALGLIITRNTFGFMAFMGMISLCGIVVRNAIILIDYIKEKLREGLPLVDAAIQAGERRLRPIFLTTMAAAVGFIPMIASGSKLWSPLASVMAVGLVCSMFFTLLVVPVLYVLVSRRKATKASGPSVPAVLGLLGVLFLAPSLHAVEAPAPRKVTLEEAIQVALKKSAGVTIAHAKVDEAQAKRRVARADFLPQLTVDGSWMKRNDAPFVEVGAGALGTIPGLGPFPTQDVQLGQGKTHLYLQNVTLGQPLTQLFKIHHGYEVASADERIARAELRRMEADIAFKTRQAYEGILIARAQLEAAKAGVLAAETADLDAQRAVRSGSALAVLQTGSKAQLLQIRHKRLSAETAIADLSSELNDLMGSPIDTPLDLAPVALRAKPLPSRETLLEEALRTNPDLQAAKATSEKSRRALSAGKADFIPELSAFARQVHQEGVSYLERNTKMVGLSLSWSVFDGGRKAAVVSQRAALVNQAGENQRRISSRVEIDLGKVLRKLDTAQLQVEAAEEGFALKAEEARLAANQFRGGILPEAKRNGAEALAKAAEADRLAAQLALDLAYAELDQLLGHW